MSQGINKIEQGLTDIRDMLIEDQQRINDSVMYINKIIKAYDTDDYIIYFKEKGLSYQAIGEKLGLSSTSVFNKCKKLREEGKIL
jgi:hypothetical protein